MSTNSISPQKTTRPRQLTGEVVRRSGDKTVAVAVKRAVSHPLYHKRSTVTTTYLAHDPKNESQVGQQVTIREHRPLSRHKRWLIVSSATK